MFLYLSGLFPLTDINDLIYNACLNFAHAVENGDLIEGIEKFYPKVRKLLKSNKTIKLDRFSEAIAVINVARDELGDSLYQNAERRTSIINKLDRCEIIICKKWDGKVTNRRDFLETIGKQYSRIIQSVITFTRGENYVQMAGLGDAKEFLRISKEMILLKYEMMNISQITEGLECIPGIGLESMLATIISHQSSFGLETGFSFLQTRDRTAGSREVKLEK